MRACIFDLDGVLVDTAKYHFIAWRNLANKLGVEFSEHDNEQLKGLSRDASLEYILTKGDIDSTFEQREQWKEEKNNEYLALVLQMNEDETLPNAKELLQELKSNNIRLALGSASKNAELILDRVNIKHYFDAIIDGTKTSRSKPDPEVFLLGAKALNCEPHECIVFEDALNGVKAAKAGGFYAIGIGEPEVLIEADKVYASLSSINFKMLELLS
ncbi:MAG: beta-phosphoglucomutase [bacterium]|jgi:beta-phosphoglucomutase